MSPELQARWRNGWGGVRLLFPLLLAVVVGMIPFRDLDERLRIRLGLSLKGMPDSRIVIVHITDDCRQVWHSWPLPRRVYAKAIDRLTAAGAQAIALDVLFLHPSPGERSQDDARLIDAVRSNGRVVLPSILRFEAVLGNDMKLNRRLRSIEPFDALRADAASIGFCTINPLSIPDPDPILTDVPVALRYGGTRHGSFALRAIEKFLGERLEEHPYVSVRHLDTLSVGGIPGPSGEEGTISILGLAFPRIPHGSWTLRDLVSADDLEDFRGKLVFIGAGSSIADDLEYTAAGFQPGVDINAVIADNLLNRSGSQPSPSWLFWSAMLISALLTVPRRRVSGFLHVVRAPLVVAAVVVPLSWFATQAGLRFPVLPFLVLAALTPPLSLSLLHAERALSRRARLRYDETEDSRFIEAEAAFYRDELRAAETGFRAIIRDNPHRSPRSRFLLGLTLIKLGLFDRAAGLVATAAIDDQDTHHLLALVDAQIELGDVTGASRIMEIMDSRVDLREEISIRRDKLDSLAESEELPLDAGLDWIDEFLTNHLPSPYQRGPLIGQGGMGLVYSAYDETRDRRVAVKILRPELASTQDTKTRFLREAQILSSLDHECLLDVYHISRTELPFFVMEYLEGTSLEAVVENGQRLPPQTALNYTLQILDSLAYLHDRDLIHRDVKPDNVQVLPSRRIKLLDFGLVKALDLTALTRTGMVIGTLKYMAPEQMLGEPVSFPADVFATGILMFTLLTGRYAYDSEMIGAPMMMPPRKLDDLLVGLPSGLSEVLSKALEADQEARYPTAREFYAALEPFRHTVVDDEVTCVKA